MNSKIRFILLALLACAGVFLLGDGISGLVTNDAACASCSTLSQINLMWGALIVVVVGVAIYSIYSHSRQ